MNRPRFAHGVNVVGYFKAEAGVGEAARLLVTALRAAEIPSALVPHEDTLSRQNVRVENAGNEPIYGTTIVCVNADEFPRFVSIADPSLFSDRYVIAMWWWEVEAFPERMAAAASLVDEVWVGSRHTANALTEAVSVPVYVCPPPILPPSPAPLGRRDLGLPDDYVFLFAFDFLSVFERKNPLAVVEAFKRAFAPNDGATLVLRAINGDQNPDDLARLRGAVQDRPAIRLIEGYLDAEVQYALVACCDAYVSLHRAEGFGLTLAEAMALGKPVIGTAYSGNLEFMDDANSYLVRYRLVPIGEGYDPYPASARWAEPDVEQAAQLMRHVFEHPQEARERGERARRAVEELHSPAARAPVVAERLADAAKRMPQVNEARKARAAERVRRWHGTGQVPALERAALHLSGGPKVVGPSRRGPLGEIYRRLLLTVLRHYRHYEHERTAALVAAAREQREGLEDLRRRIDRELGSVPPAASDIRCTVRDSNGRVGIGFRADSLESWSVDDLVSGSTDVTRTRYRGYLPLLEGNAPVLVLASRADPMRDLLPAAGLRVESRDSNRSLGERVRGRPESLDVLGRQPDGSLGAVFCDDEAVRSARERLRELLELVERKLRPGGLLLCESINPHSFPAFRASWIDPVRGAPIFPETLVALCRQLGYVEAVVSFHEADGDLHAGRRSAGHYALSARTAAVTSSA